MTSALGELAGRHALVTGASRGIGRVTALHLASRGAQLTVHGRDDEALAQVRAVIEADGGTCRAVTGDLTEATRVVDIVSMSSSAARRPSTQSPVAYAAAKAGVEALTKHVVLQAGPARRSA